MSEQVTLLFQMVQAISQYKEYENCFIQFWPDGFGHFINGFTPHKREWTFDSPSEGIEMLWYLLMDAHRGV